MPRTIYLAVFSNGRRPAHWAIFVPNTEAGNVGKLIHVTGSPAAGFFLGFKREYDFGETHQQYRLIPLAAVEECFVATPKADAPKTIDDTPCDRLEMVAKIVDPPPSCSNPFDPSNERCQGWIQRYVQQLVDEGFLDHNALLVIQNAPKVLSG